MSPAPPSRPRTTWWWLGRGFLSLVVIGGIAAGTWRLLLGAWPWEPLASNQPQPVCQLPPESVASASHPYPGMVWVPAGQMVMGDTVYPEEQPLVPKKVAGFWMDRTEVTNDQFAQFVSATGYVTVAEKPVNAVTHPGLPPDMASPGAVVFVPPKDIQGLTDVTQWWRYVPGANWRHPGGPHTDWVGKGSFPVVGLSYIDAKAYAKWKGHQLPTEAQWEWAARGALHAPAGATGAGAATHDQPRQANTWQGLFPVQNLAEDGFVGVAPVGCYAPNALGLWDMVGNVWEMTDDLWQDNHLDNTPEPDQVPPALRPGEVSRRVIKGGSFLCAPNYCLRYRAGARQPQEDDLATSHLGFRTILVAPGPSATAGKK